GTTNVAGFLVDLQSGARVASLGIENPQVVWGADVISRMNHAMQGSASAADLRQAASTAINALAHDLCLSIGAGTADIVDVAICGNTAMHHLLLGLPVRQLGRAPFVAAVRDAMDVKARELDLTVCPGAYVHLAPNIGGFVGSDHVTALLATQDLWHRATATLVTDIGTNTEISLIHRGNITSASCPSGPALEGGHISCGMRAAEGAIERVTVENGRIKIAAIGNRQPVGLCGSGVIDALAALRQAGILDDGGRIAGRHPDIEDVDGKRAAVLAPGVHFNQHDVRAVQLAKAAIRTGIELLLRDRDLREDDIELVVIAGAFGSYIDVGSAIAIGLLPALPLDRFKQVGNAAGAGVRQLLASRQARARGRELAKACRYLELSTRGDFQKTFLHNIGFKSRPK
ncbi:MAG TPA: ASKHA domain-containing protein, partial [Pseudolabrys sp.]|nr:ASKHA domain-containing protein [Pseudolabrys sp.]